MDWYLGDEITYFFFHGGQPLTIFTTEISFFAFTEILALKITESQSHKKI